MPHVLLDASKTHNLHSGLGQFGWHLTRALAAEAPEGMALTAVVRRGSGLPDVGPLTTVQQRLRPLTWWRRRERDADLFHGFQQLSRLRPPRGVPRVLTVHDLNFLVEKSPAKARRYLRRVQREVDGAAALTAISAYTKRQMEAHLELRGREVTVIHNGVPAPPPGPYAWPSTVPAGRPYFLSLGLVSARKAQAALLPLLEAFPEHALVCAGPTRERYAEALRQAAARTAPARTAPARLLLPGGVSEAEKQRLYAHATALVFASRAEGFGLPVAEVLHHGRPVVLASGGALEEVAGPLGDYFDPEDAGSLLAAARAALARPSDFAEAARRRARALDWATAARAYLRVYADV